MTKKDERNYTIDFWRFIFSICLVLFHAYMVLEKKAGDFSLFSRGSICVEFFFLVSGFLMANSINKQKNTKNSTDGLFSFIIKKIKGLYPAFLISWIISFIIINVVTFNGIKNICLNLLSSFFELALLRNAGFNSVRFVPQSWYISAMILSMFIIYPIYNKNKKKFEKYYAPLISVLILGYLFYNTKSLVNPNKYLGIIYKSTLRAFSEICLGIFAYYITTNFKKIDFTKLGKCFISLIELFGYIFTLIYMQFFNYFNSTYDFLILFLLFISIIISFSNKSYSKNIFNNNLFKWLGKYSLYIYLMYYPFTIVIPKIFPSFTTSEKLSLYIGATLISALLVMFLEKYMVKIFNKLKKMLVNE